MPFGNGARRSFEYRLVAFREKEKGSYDPDAYERELNDLGKEGWEVCAAIPSITPPVLVMKRVITPATQG